MRKWLSFSSRSQRPLQSPYNHPQLTYNYEVRWPPRSRGSCPVRLGALYVVCATAYGFQADFVADIWNTLIAGSTTSTAAVRQPVNNSPVTSPTASNYICNTNTAATATVSVAAGSTIGFKLDNTVYHLGPAAIYLGKVPSGSTAASWSGSGASWFKIAEWGATYPGGSNSAMSFADFNAGQLTTTLPSDIPAGDVRVLCHRYIVRPADGYTVPRQDRADRPPRRERPAVVHVLRADHRHWRWLCQPDEGLHAAVLGVRQGPHRRHLLQPGAVPLRRPGPAPLHRMSIVDSSLYFVFASYVTVFVTVHLRAWHPRISGVTCHSAYMPHKHYR
jgi:hypothetical protein